MITNLLGDRRGGARRRIMEKWAGWGNGTHDVGMIETLERLHLAHTLSSFPLSFFFGIGLARDIPRRHLGRDISRGCKGERGGGRVVMRGGVDGLRGTQRGLTVLVVRGMLCARVYTPRNFHTHHNLFQTSQSRGRRGYRSGFSCSPTAVSPSPFGNRGEKIPLSLR
jgi:hypothetical protein